MARYFFHLFNHVDAPDLEGRELPDDAAARDTAIADARALAAEDVRAGRLNLSHRIDVEDRFRQLVCTVRYRDAISVSE
jgi:hypothetical protein